MAKAFYGIVDRASGEVVQTVAGRAEARAIVRESGGTLKSTEYGQRIAPYLGRGRPLAEARGHKEELGPRSQVIHEGKKLGLKDRPVNVIGGGKYPIRSLARLRELVEKTPGRELTIAVKAQLYRMRGRKGIRQIAGRISRAGALRAIESSDTLVEALDKMRIAREPFTGKVYEVQAWGHHGEK